jgi:type I restriction enzyme S subunit
VSAELLLREFERLGEGPDAIARLRRFVLDLAVRGLLAQQNSSEQSAERLISQIAASPREQPLRPAYQAIVDSPVEDEPFSVPASWSWTRLGRVTDLIQRGKSPTYSESTGPHVVSQKCVRWEGLDLAPARMLAPESLSAYEPHRFLRDQDLLWNSTGTGTIGRVARLIAPPPNLVCDSHVTVVRCSRLNAEYVRLWLRSDHVYGRIEGDASGSTNQVELTLQMALAMPLPLPPLTEQNRIVAKVGELMGLCDQLEAAQEERETWRGALRSVSLHRLKVDDTPGAEDVGFFLSQAPRLLTKPADVAAVRQMILELALTGRLVEEDPSDGDADALIAEALAAKTAWTGRASRQRSFESPATVAEFELPKVPKSWRWTRLDAIADIVSGVTKDSKTQAQAGLIEVPYLRVANVQRGFLDLARMATIKVSPETVTRLALEPGDLLFNEGGDRDKLGRGWIWEGQVPRCIHQNHVFRARLFAPIIAQQLVSWHGNTFGQQWFIEGGKQTTNLASLNKTTLSAFPVPIPPKAQQDRIVAKVDELMTVCDELEAALISAQQARGQLLESLLRDALEAPADRAAVQDFASVV